MSLTYTQILAKINQNLSTDSTTYPTADKTVDINLAIDNLLLILFGTAGGTWQFDDSNQTDYPIITTNLVSGQRDYSFTTDNTGNLILDIYKVQIKDSSGIYQDITPVDQQTTDIPNSFADGQNLTGTPTCYDKTGNGIFLDLIPSYNSTNGLRVFVNREATYFTTSDTNKKLGFSGLYHQYLVLFPCYEYARARGLDSANRFKSDMLELESRIKFNAGQRERDVKRKMTPLYQNNK